MVVQEEQYLAHYGVKGMKWGKRKAQLKEASTAARKVEDSVKSKYKSDMKKLKANYKKEKKAAINNLDTYSRKTRFNTNTRALGYAAKIASGILSSKSKGVVKKGNIVYLNGTESQQRVNKGKQTAADLLNAFGNVAITGSMLKQWSDFKKYY